MVGNKGYRPRTCQWVTNKLGRASFLFYFQYFIAINDKPTIFTIEHPCCEPGRLVVRALMIKSCKGKLNAHERQVPVCGDHGVVGNEVKLLTFKKLTKQW